MANSQLNLEKAQLIGLRSIIFDGWILQKCYVKVYYLYLHSPKTMVAEGKRKTNKKLNYNVTASNLNTHFNTMITFVQSLWL